MKEWNLSAIVLGLIAVILGVVLFGGDKTPDYPALELYVTPTVIHPPADVSATVNYDAFPDGTVFEFWVNGAKVGTGLRMVGTGIGYPAVYAAKAVLDGNVIGEDSIALKLKNEIPRFYNFWTPSVPEGGMRLGFHLYYRQRGCDVSGKPTAITGIADPDFTIANPYSDQTDNWDYQVAVYDIDTGYRENVYYLDANGSIRLMGDGDWTKDPRFVWTPWVKVGDNPPVPINIVDFPNIPPKTNVSAMSALAPSEASLDTGFAWQPTVGVNPMANLPATVTPLSCVRPTPDPVETPTGEPNKRVVVRVREFGTIYENSYLMYAYMGTCAGY